VCVLVAKWSSQSLLAQAELPLSLLSPPSVPDSTNPSTSQPSAVITPVTNEKTKKHLLSAATDPLFAELRDLNFSSVGKRLNRVAHRIDEDYKVSGLRSRTWILSHAPYRLV
jgi:hypothetical protein